MNKVIIALLLIFSTPALYSEKHRVVYTDKEAGVEQLGFFDWFYDWFYPPAPKQNNWNFTNVLKAEELLGKHIKGQPEAISIVSDTLICKAANLNDPKKPVGVFLFVGPTGVGKTELAKAIAREFLGSEDLIVRLNMTDYTDHYDMWKLIGSSPGYVNHDDGGQLTNGIRKNPHTVVLLDEMEKAHPAIQKAFLSIFDEGFIFDNNSKKVDCKNCLFIMTSNYMSQKILALSHEGLNQEEILDTIEHDLVKGFSPELYNRVVPVVFNAIKKEVFKELVDLMLSQVVQNVKDKKGIALNIDQSVLDYLEEHGYSEELGVRPLKRLIEIKIVSNVAKVVVKHKIPKGSSMDILYEPVKNEWIIEWE